MAPRRKLGELLLSEGLIDEVQLSSAIGHQRNWGGKLGSTLVELGFISEVDIARVLQSQLKQDVLGDKDLVPQPGVLSLIDGQEALRMEVLPLRYEGGALVMAMSNPYDLAVVDSLGFKLGKRIKGMLAVESSLKKAIKKYYFGEDAGHDHRIRLKTSGSAEKMKVIHSGNRHGNFQDGIKEEAREEPKDQPRKVEPSADLIAKALAYLLIEKGIVSRDELVEKMKALHEKS